MAGSFDAYDPAVVARDAIRAMDTRMPLSCASWMENGSAAPVPQPKTFAERENACGHFFETGAVEVRTGGVEVAEARTTNASARPVPTTANEIETWAEVRGRVYNVQVGAFRGVPDERALSALGTLTREDAGPMASCACFQVALTPRRKRGRICRHFRTMVDRMPLLWSTSMADAFPCWKRARRRPGDWT